MLAGKWIARATGAELGYAGTGTEQVAVEFEVVEEGECQGERIVWYGYFSEAAARRTIESLRHTGWKGDDLSNLSTVGSQDCQIDVQPEEYEGRTRLKVAWVNSANGGLALKERMSDEERRAFAAKMRGVVLSLGNGKPTPAAKPATPARAPSRTPAGKSAPARASAQPSNHPFAPGGAADAPPIDDDLIF